MSPDQAQTLLTERTPVEFCPVCGSGDSRQWRVVKGWPLDRCRNCGMVYANSIPTEAALQAAYALPKEEYDQFFQSSYIDTEYILGGQAEWKIARAEKFLAKIEQKLGRKGRILELGCGPGAFLEVARWHGWETAGVDPGDWQGSQEIDKVLNIQRCSLFDAAFEENSFDAVFMSSVLEHLADPQRYLEALYRVIKPDGLISVVGLPNINSWTILLGIDRWIGNHPPLHLQYFSRRSARVLFSKVGFREIVIPCYGLSETILDMFFNRAATPHRGDYTEKVYQGSWRGMAICSLRFSIYRLFNVTGTGSVIEVFAFKRPVQSVEKKPGAAGR